MQVSLIGIAIFTLALSVVLFLCMYLGFRTGLRISMRAAKGIEPEPLKSPLKIVNDIKRNAKIEKSEELFNEGMKNIFSYTGDVKDGDA